MSSSTAIGVAVSTSSPPVVYHDANIASALSVAPFRSFSKLLDEKEAAPLTRGRLNALCGGDPAQRQRREEFEAVVIPPSPLGHHSSSSSSVVPVQVEPFSRSAAGKVIDPAVQRTPLALEKAMHFLVQHYLRRPHTPLVYLDCFKIWEYLWDRLRGIRTTWGPQLPPCNAKVAGFIDGHTGQLLPAAQLQKESWRRVKWLEFTVAALAVGGAYLCSSGEGCSRFMQDKKIFIESMSQCFTDLTVWYRAEQRNRNAEFFSVLLLLYGLNQEMKVEDRSSFCRMYSVTVNGEPQLCPEPATESVNLAQVYRELEKQPYLIETQPVRLALGLIDTWARGEWFEFFHRCRENSLTLLQRAILFQSFTYARFRAVLDLVVPNYFLYPKLRVRTPLSVTELAELLMMDEDTCLLFLRRMGLSSLLERVEKYPDENGDGEDAAEPASGWRLHLCDERSEPLTTIRELEERCANKRDLFLPTYPEYFGFRLAREAYNQFPNASLVVAPSMKRGSRPNSSDELDDYMPSGDDEGGDTGANDADVAMSAAEGRCLRQLGCPVNLMEVLEVYCPPYNTDVAALKLSDAADLLFSSVQADRAAMLRRSAKVHANASKWQTSTSSSPSRSHYSTEVDSKDADDDGIDSKLLRRLDAEESLSTSSSLFDVDDEEADVNAFSGNENDVPVSASEEPDAIPPAVAEARRLLHDIAANPMYAEVAVEVAKRAAAESAAAQSIKKTVAVVDKQESKLPPGSPPAPTCATAAMPRPTLALTAVAPTVVTPLPDGFEGDPDERCTAQTASVVVESPASTLLDPSWRDASPLLSGSHARPLDNRQAAEDVLPSRVPPSNTPPPPPPPPPQFKTAMPSTAAAVQSLSARLPSPTAAPPAPLFARAAGTAELGAPAAAAAATPAGPTTPAVVDDSIPQSSGSSIPSVEYSNLSSSNSSDGETEEVKVELVSRQTAPEERPQGQQLPTAAAAAAVASSAVFAGGQMPIQHLPRDADDASSRTAQRQRYLAQLQHSSRADRNLASRLLYPRLQSSSRWSLRRRADESRRSAGSTSLLASSHSTASEPLALFSGVCVLAAQDYLVGVAKLFYGDATSLASLASGPSATARRTGQWSRYHRLALEALRAAILASDWSETTRQAWLATLFHPRKSKIGVSSQQDRQQRLVLFCAAFCRGFSAAMVPRFELAASTFSSSHSNAKSDSANDSSAVAMNALQATLEDLLGGLNATSNLSIGPPGAMAQVESSAPTTVPDSISLSSAVVLSLAEKQLRKDAITGTPAVVQWDSSLRTRVVWQPRTAADEIASQSAAAFELVQPLDRRVLQLTFNMVWVSSSSTRVCQVPLHHCSGEGGGAEGPDTLPVPMPRAATHASASLACEDDRASVMHHLFLLPCERWLVSLFLSPATAAEGGDAVVWMTAVQEEEEKLLLAAAHGPGSGEKGGGRHAASSVELHSSLVARLSIVDSFTELHLRSAAVAAPLSCRIALYGTEPSALPQLRISRDGRAQLTNSAATHANDDTATAAAAPAHLATATPHFTALVCVDVMSHDAICRVHAVLAAVVCSHVGASASAAKEKSVAGVLFCFIAPDLSTPFADDSYKAQVQDRIQMVQAEVEATFWELWRSHQQHLSALDSFADATPPRKRPCTEAQQPGGSRHNLAASNLPPAAAVGPISVSQSATRSRWSSRSRLYGAAYSPATRSKAEPERSVVSPADDEAQQQLSLQKSITAPVLVSIVVPYGNDGAAKRAVEEGMHAMMSSYAATVQQALQWRAADMVYLRAVTPSLCRVIDAAVGDAAEGAKKDLVNAFIEERLIVLLHTQPPSQLAGAMWVLLLCERELHRRTSPEGDRLRQNTEDDATVSEAADIFALALPTGVAELVEAVLWCTGEAATTTSSATSQDKFISKTSVPAPPLDELLRRRISEPPSSSQQQQNGERSPLPSNRIASFNLALQSLQLHYGRSGHLLQPRSLSLLVRSLTSLWCVVHLCKCIRQHHQQRLGDLVGQTTNQQTKEAPPITLNFHDYEVLLPWSLVSAVLSPASADDDAPASISMTSLLDRCRGVAGTGAVNSAPPLSLIINPAVTNLSDNPSRIGKNKRLDAIEEAASKYYYTLLATHRGGNSTAAVERGRSGAIVPVGATDFDVLDATKLQPPSWSSSGASTCTSASTSSLASAVKEESFSSFLREASIGLDIQIMAFTGAAVGYYLGYLRGLSAELCTMYAIIGLVAMMIVDAVLLLLRVNKQDEMTLKRRLKIQRRRQRVEKEGSAMVAAMQAALETASLPKDALEERDSRTPVELDAATKKNQ